MLTPNSGRRASQVVWLLTLAVLSISSAACEYGPRLRIRNTAEIPVKVYWQPSGSRQKDSTGFSKTPQFQIGPGEEVRTFIITSDNNKLNRTLTVEARNDREDVLFCRTYADPDLRD